VFKLLDFFAGYWGKGPRWQADDLFSQAGGHAAASSRGRVGDVIVHTLRAASKQKWAWFDKNEHA